MRPGVLLLAGALAAGQEAPPHEDPDLGLLVTTEGSEVEFGKAFPLTVVRAWRRDLVPEEWSDEALAPLVLRLVDVHRREAAGRIEETRRYRAYVFVAGDVAVRAPKFRATPAEGGPARVAIGDGLVLRVAPALAAAAGPVELPGEPFRPPVRWLLWAGIGGGALAVLLLFVRWRSRRIAAPRAQVVAPDARVLQRLDELRTQEPQDRAQFRADSVTLSALARAWVAERFSTGAPPMTSEEFAHDLEREPSLGASHRATLADFLAHCDRVKFSPHAPTAAERRRHLNALAALVRETRAET